MLKNLLIFTLVFGLLQFAVSGTATGKKIDLWKCGQEGTLCTGVLLKDRIIQFDDKTKRFTKGELFQYKYNKDEPEYEAGFASNVPVRIVMDELAEPNRIKYDEPKVTISEKKGSDAIATGSLSAINSKFWKLRFSYSPKSNPSNNTDEQVQGTAEEIEAYVEGLKPKFSNAEILYPKGENFKFFGWDGLYGRVERSEPGLTNANKKVLVVQFATCKKSIVRKNADTENYNVYHMSTLVADNGRLVGDGVTINDFFSVGNLILYTSTGEIDNKVRPIIDSPLRIITTTDIHTNSFEFTKVMVTILYGTESKEQVGTLFAADKDHNRITIEVAYVGTVNETFVRGIIRGQSTYTIKPIGKGLAERAEYTVIEMKEFKGDHWTKKESMRICLTKANKK